MIYPFMKLFGHGIVTTLPTRPENSFNIVPVDFVIKAAIAITAQPSSIGKTFHLVTPEPPTIGMLLRLKDEKYPNAPPITMVRPEDFRKENLEPNQQMIYDILTPYLGYLNDHLTFDMTNTERALRGTGISLPKTDYHFLRVIVDYAVSAGYLEIA